MMGPKGKEALLYRKKKKYQQVQMGGAMEFKQWMPKTSGWKLLGNMMTKNIKTMPKNCLPLRLLTNHLLIHMVQFDNHHLNQVIKFSLTNGGICFPTNCNVTYHTCDAPNPDSRSNIQFMAVQDIKKQRK